MESAGSIFRDDQDRLHTRQRLRWLPWILGAALLLTVVAVALHFSEAQAFIRLAERSEPGWLLLALILQAATYWAQGEIWRSVGRVAGWPLSLPLAYQMSLAKLFIDQTFPSAGLSGTVVLARSLEARGMPRAAVTAGVVVNIASYHAVYVATLCAALLIMAAHHQANPLVEWVSAALALFGAALTVAVLTLSGRSAAAVRKRLGRLRPLQTVLTFLSEADPRLAHDPRLLFAAGGYQLGIVLLDAATIWVLILALGDFASPSGVFASFMISTLFRTIGLLPGGLGTFEATSVWTLKLVGVPLPVALSATLLFRGLSFWLPMMPGLWFSRRAAVPHPADLKGADLDRYWTLESAELFRRLQTGPAGLSSDDAADRLRRTGPNQIEARPRRRLLLHLLRRFGNPLVLILLVAAAVSAVTRDPTSFIIITIIVLLSVLLDSLQEHRAEGAAERLRRQIALRVRVLRDGQPRDAPAAEIVPGDVVLLSAGDLVPADGRLIEAKDLFVNEAMLTGEPYPAEKEARDLLQDERAATVPVNGLFMGSSIVSGTAQAVIIAVGRATRLGKMAHALRKEPPPTAFTLGIRDFGLLIARITVLLVLFVMWVNLLFERPLLQSFLFALALAVGLTPELLPMIVSVTLAHGAIRISRKEVIVKRLSAIHDLGSMDLFCSDKTGTLTEARIKLVREVDLTGAESRDVLRIAYLNAAFETGLKSPLDQALLEAEPVDLAGWRKIDEVPFDFQRRRVSVLVEKESERLLAVKGAPEEMIALSSHYQRAGAASPLLLDEAARATAQDVFQKLGREGFRVLGVAWRRVGPEREHARVDDESGLIFSGFAAFLDPPKESARKALEALARLGIGVKIVTGDNEQVTQHLCGELGIAVSGILTGPEVSLLPDPALGARAEGVNLFCRVTPPQKERIIRALRRRGHVVGYLGDGINDAPPLQAADVGLSVESAADIARETAAMVLLKKDLGVLAEAVREGRAASANILKYVMMGTSSNFGNMLSMAAGVLFLPFLPMLPVQILLNNLLYDFSEAAIPLDRVDPDMVERPRHWDMKFVRNYMIIMGPVSSFFDLLTFGLLLNLFQSGEALFHTGWFMESLVTQVLVIFVIRTRGSPFKSRPHPLLVVSSLAVLLVALILPYTPIGAWFGFVPSSPLLLLSLALLTGLYLFAVEQVKRRFYGRNASA